MISVGVLYVVVNMKNTLHIIVGINEEKQKKIQGISLLKVEKGCFV